MGVSENQGYLLIFGVLIIRILLFGTILGSPIFGNSHIVHAHCPEGPHQSTLAYQLQPMPLAHNSARPCVKDASKLEA